MADIYDTEIERLVGMSSDHLRYAWRYFYPLFQSASPSGRAECIPGTNDRCGCPTIIKSRKDHFHISPRGWTPAVTRMIRASRGIPADMERFCDQWDGMTKKRQRNVLMAFARVQRRLDKMIRQPQEAP